MLSLLCFLFFALFSVLNLNVLKFLAPFDQYLSLSNRLLRASGALALGEFGYPYFHSHSLRAVALKLTDLWNLLNWHVLETILLEEALRQSRRLRVLLTEPLAVKGLVEEATLAVLPLHVHAIDFSLHFFFHFTLLEQHLILFCLSAAQLALRLAIVLR